MHNWDYKPDVARSELCCLIAMLDLSLGIAVLVRQIHGRNTLFVLITLGLLGFLDKPPLEILVSYLLNVVICLRIICCLVLHLLL